MLCVSSAKPMQAPLIKKYTKGENNKDMSQRVRNLDSDDSVTGGSNLGKFIKLLESDGSDWIKEISREIE